MSSIVLIISYCLLIVTVSMLGGVLPSLVRLPHSRMQVVVSLVAGLMLGVAVFHLLPHAAAHVESLDRLMWWLMVGLLVMFFLLRAFHFHQHGSAEAHDHDHDHDHDHGHEHDHDAPPVHHHHHDHDHDHDHAGDVAGGRRHRLSWMGVAFGLGLHTFIDGLALGAAVEAESRDHDGLGLYGLGIFLAIALHKPLDAMSITSLMAAGGWSAAWQRAVNVGFAMMCPLGALLFTFGVRQLETGNQGLVVGLALAFSAGVFLCISLSDLLPEVQFHSHDRIKLSVALLLGVALAYGIGFLEPAHAHHGHSHDHAHQGHDHTEHGLTTIRKSER